MSQKQVASQEGWKMWLINSPSQKKKKEKYTYDIKERASHIFDGISTII